MKKEYERLKAQWGGDPEFDGWFAHPLNNAHLNSVAAYYDLVPAFEQLLAKNSGDLEKFYQAAEALSKKPRTERHEELRALAAGQRRQVEVSLSKVHAAHSTFQRNADR